MTSVSTIARCLHALAAIALLVWIQPPDGLLAQATPSQQKPAGPKPVSISANQLGVDLLYTNDRTLRGFVLSHRAPKTVFAIDRQWLYETFPEAKPDYQRREQSRLKPTLATYNERIENWIREKREDATLVRVLEQERERIRNSNNTPEIDDKLFLVLEFEGNGIRLRRQPANRRRLAAFAYQNNLDRVATRKISDLKRELDQLAPNWNLQEIDLSFGLPAAELTTEQWEIRQAIVEYSVSKKLQFQGEGDFLVRADARPDVTTLMTQMLSQSRQSNLERIGRELGVPEFTVPQDRPDHWKTKVTREADAEGIRCVMVKRIVSTNNPDEVAVKATFLARVGSDWKSVFEKQATARLSEQSSDKMEQLKSEPGIQTVLKLANGLGGALGGGQNSLVEQAMRKGAATQQALLRVNSLSNSLIERNSLYLDAPLILD